MLFGNIQEISYHKRWQCATLNNTTTKESMKRQCIFVAKAMQPKQGEVKRGYLADVTLRDIERQSILSSRRNTPPKILQRFICVLKFRSSPLFLRALCFMFVCFIFGVIKYSFWSIRYNLLWCE